MVLINSIVSVKDVLKVLHLIQDSAVVVSHSSSYWSKSTSNIISNILSVTLSLDLGWFCTRSINCSFEGVSLNLEKNLLAKKLNASISSDV